MPDTPYSKFENSKLILRDELAIDRTLLANERTLLAYLRSAIALLIAGVSILHFADRAWFSAVGIACMPIGLITGVIGIARYRAMNRGIRLVRERSAGPSPVNAGPEAPP